MLFVSLCSWKVTAVHLQIQRIMKDLFNHISLKVEGGETIALSHPGSLSLSRSFCLLLSSSEPKFKLL